MSNSLKIMVSRYNKFSKDILILVGQVDSAKTIPLRYMLDKVLTPRDDMSLSNQQI